MSSRSPNAVFIAAKEIRLVIDHNIVFGGATPFHMVQHLFLVQIDHDSALHGIPDAGALDLARLEYDVAVRQHGRRPQRAQMRNRLQGVRKQPAGEGIFEQELRHISSSLGSSTSSPARNSCKLPK